MNINRNKNSKNYSNDINFTNFDYNRIKNITNPTTLHNYLISLIEELNKKDEKIIKLTKDNDSLLTRIRNTNYK